VVLGTRLLQVIVLHVAVFGVVVLHEIVAQVEILQAVVLVTGLLQVISTTNQGTRDWTTSSHRSGYSEFPLVLSASQDRLYKICSCSDVGRTLAGTTADVGRTLVLQ
jgi:hypothetical protein